MSQNTLELYRKMLKAAKLMNGKQKVDALKLIRSEFRRNHDENDQDKVRTMLEKANSSLSYIKIVTPKRFEAREQTGETVIKYGTEVKQNRAVSNWTGSNMDPDSVARHYRTLKRAGFKDNNHAKGGMF